MRYLVMESRPGYAIVVDENGKFLKVVNRGYLVGDKVDSVIFFNEPLKKPITCRKVFTAVAAAACICIMFLGAYQTFLLPYGTVRIQINPDVLLSVNRQNHIVELEGLNDDGEELIEGYKYFWKDVAIVSDELADIAVEKGFLSDGGDITIDIVSEHNDWKVATEELLITELTIHFEEKVNVQLKSQNIEETESIVTPGGESNYDDDDYDDPDDYQEGESVSPYEESDSNYEESDDDDSDDD